MDLRKFLSLTLIVLYTTAALFWALQLRGQAFAGTVVKSADTQLQSGNSLVDDINLARLNAGLPILLIDTNLSQIAEERNQDMINQEYYDHFSPQGRIFSDLMSDKKIRYSFACENLDLSFEPTKPAFVRDWLESKKGHRECLLSDQVTRIGVAVATKPVPGVPDALIATAIISN